MKKEQVSLWEQNMKALSAERVHLAGYAVRKEREKREHELALARASAPVVNVTIRRYDW